MLLPPFLHYSHKKICMYSDMQLPIFALNLVNFIGIINQ